MMWSLAKPLNRKIPDVYRNISDDKRQDMLELLPKLVSIALPLAIAARCMYDCSLSVRVPDGIFFSFFF